MIWLQDCSDPSGHHHCICRHSPHQAEKLLGTSDTYQPEVYLFLVTHKFVYKKTWQIEYVDVTCVSLKQVMPIGKHKAPYSNDFPVISGEN